MKKSSLVALALMVSFSLVQGAFAGCVDGSCSAPSQSQACAPADQPGCGPCVCLTPYVRYKPVYDCVKRYESEEYQVQKRCCRQVPEYYEKTHCRYVPEYYKTQHCRYKPEKYTVCETKYRNVYVKDTHCRYIPQTYYKKVCTNVTGDCVDPCNVDPCKEYRGSGPSVCWCPQVRYIPQNYCTTRCVQEPYTVQKQCCRYVPENYELTHCRYRPEYYKTQHCRYKNEYYCVCETKCRPKCVTEKVCRYVPVTYYKKECKNQCDLGGCSAKS